MIEKDRGVSSMDKNKNAAVYIYRCGRCSISMRSTAIDRILSDSVA